MPISLNILLRNIACWKVSLRAIEASYYGKQTFYLFVLFPILNLQLYRMGLDFRAAGITKSIVIILGRSTRSQVFNSSRSYSFLFSRVSTINDFFIGSRIF